MGFANYSNSRPNASPKLHNKEQSPKGVVFQGKNGALVPFIGVKYVKKLQLLGY